MNGLILAPDIFPSPQLSCNAKENYSDVEVRAMYQRLADWEVFGAEVPAAVRSMRCIVMNHNWGQQDPGDTEKHRGESR